MFLHYTKIIIRNLWREKTYSLINIGGLAIGMACFLLILFYVRFEESYDSFHANGDRIYRVLRESTSEGVVDKRANTGPPLAPLLVQNYPGISRAVRFTSFFGGMVGSGEQYFNEPRFLFADNSVFGAFTFPLLRGDPKTALEEPFSIVLTPDMARKYFGDADPINCYLTYRSQFQKEKAQFKVTGIVKEIPANSHIKFDFLASYSSLRPIIGSDFMDQRWESPTWVYIELQPGYTPAELEKQLPAFVDKYVDKENYSSIKFSLQPLKDIYYHSLGMGGIFGDFGIEIISWILLFVAGLILLIACFNFMNLMTARAPTRSREIAMRKVMGADRKRLIAQFIGESLFSSFLALALAVVIVELALPGFKSLVKSAFATFGIFTPRQIDLGLSQNVIVIILTALAVGIVSGIYPAFYLSALQPVDVIKSTGSVGTSARFRKLLVIGQFVASAVLITCSFVIFEQISYMKNKELGFNKEHVLVIPINDRTVLGRYEVLKERLLQNPDILGVTAASQVPAVGSQNGIMLSSATHHDVDLGIIRVDRDYVRTMGMSLSSGRDFSQSMAANEDHSILMNEAAARLLGWGAAGGQEVQLYFKTSGKVVPVYQANLIGVLRDFNFRELSVPVQPLILKIDPRWYTTIFVRVNPENSRAAISYVEKCWNDFHFSQTIQYTYLSDEIDKSFSIFDTVNRLIGYGTVLAFSIACLGLFGLALFIVERKTKEIGIRKTFGASAAEIVIMLSKPFLIWVVVANLLAFPIAYYIVNQFLQMFLYRIRLGVDVFLLTGAVTICLALCTVIVEAIKAARSNPVDALRYE